MCLHDKVEIGVRACGRIFGWIKDRGGRVEMGCLAAKQAALCCCLRYCRTMLLSLLFTDLSRVVVTAPDKRSRVGGLPRASLSTDLYQKV